MKLREEVSMFEGMALTAIAATATTQVDPAAATDTSRIRLGNYRKALWHFEINTAATPSAWVGDNQNIMLRAFNTPTAVSATLATVKSVQVTGGQNMLMAEIAPVSGANVADTIVVNGVTFTCTAGGWGPTSPLEFSGATELASALNGAFTDLEATSAATSIARITVTDIGNTTINAVPSAATLVLRTGRVCADIEVEAQELNQEWPFVFARLSNSAPVAGAASPAGALGTYCVALKSGSVYKPGHNVAAARG